MKFVVYDPKLDDWAMIGEFYNEAPASSPYLYNPGFYDTWVGAPMMPSEKERTERFFDPLLSAALMTEIAEYRCDEAHDPLYDSIEAMVRYVQNPVKNPIRFNPCVKPIPALGQYSPDFIAATIAEAAAKRVAFALARIA